MPKKKIPGYDIKITRTERWDSFPTAITVYYKVGANKYQGENFMEIDEFLIAYPQFQPTLGKMVRRDDSYNDGRPKVKDIFQICQEMIEEENRKNNV